MTRAEVEQLREKLSRPNPLLVAPVLLSQVIAVLDYVNELEEEIDGLYRELGAAH
jgi:hypothetical protein